MGFESDFNGEKTSYKVQMELDVFSLDSNTHFGCI